MTVSDLKRSAGADPSPPAGLSPELRALWFTKAGQWEEAHQVAQDIHTRTGSWLHALLHLIEGDTSNAGYWFHQAGRSPVGSGQIEAEWERIAAALLGPAA
ncbi:MAG: hypothetical protein V4726_11880 [Verrucomicrobiota bacterium]